jgi:hypothetical protein
VLYAGSAAFFPMLRRWLSFCFSTRRQPAAESAESDADCMRGLEELELELESESESDSESEADSG